MVAAIILAAGASARMNGVNKQLEKLGGTPVFVMSALKFEKSEKVGEIIIAAPEEEVSRFEKLARNFGVTKLTAVVAGGDTRMNSVMNCLGEVSDKADYIAVHDGARPLIETEQIDRIIADAEKYNAAIAAVRALDTVKIAAPNGFVESTPMREKLFYAQTPQVFRKKLYLSCIEKADKTVLSTVTDDSQVLELCGEYVKLTELDGCNMKITQPADLIAAEAILNNKRTVKTV